MNCYDCHTAERTTPALAVCHHCGAGLCAEHARALPDTVHHLSGTGASTLPRRARRISCSVCAEAEALG
ncbi:hypothetical protein P3T37_001434 [Kitasatospora sp. MAA4]|uniref:DUF2180 family protein n=1 Tax=Kitasatospora sp. MAA4 TaxID=3035093 RepID=UPI0024736400|nr:DUF2180 family protein [Kitasatospora sp. MAA4]MDH6132049.1 hypothetical protein [Kitasatospora sp. MAA4]